MAELKDIGQTKKCWKCDQPIICVLKKGDGEHPDKAQWQNLSPDGKAVGAHYNYDYKTKETSCKPLNKDLGDTKKTDDTIDTNTQTGYADVPLAEKADLIEEIQSKIRGCREEIAFYTQLLDCVKGQVKAGSFTKASNLREQDLP